VTHIDGEHAELVMSAGDMIFDTPVDENLVSFAGSCWTASNPLPWKRLIGVWSIHHRINIVLAVNDTPDGGEKYTIYRTLNGVDYIPVHTHDTEIYNIFYLDDGIALFSADDDWWITTNTGLLWERMNLNEPCPAYTAVIVPMDEFDWYIIAVGFDRVIRKLRYPNTGDGWEVLLDLSHIESSFEPVVAGNAVCVIAGAGSRLWRTDFLGEDGWGLIHDFGASSYVKRLVVSGYSSRPVFLAEVYKNGKSEIWWSKDAGDTWIMNETRYDTIESAQAVIPTANDIEKAIFAVVGRRDSGTGYETKLIEISLR
jgi:hypothetical protein